jgi:hypothetical protein
VRFSQLFSFISGARKLSSADADLAGADDGARTHRRWHRKIVTSAALFGLGGLILSVPAIMQMVAEQKGRPLTRGDLKTFTAAPLILGVAGTCFGAAAACLFAPRAFLEGPLGRKWMRFIGTRSVGAARLVCLMVCVAVVALPAFFWALVTAFVNHANRQ